MKTELQNILLRRKYGTEKVFVVPYAETVAIKDKFSLHNDFTKYNNIIERGKFVDRADAEGEMSLQQIIPYGVFIFNDKCFVTQRIGGEERLLDKLSLGIGGHINPEDAHGKNGHINKGRNLLWCGLSREINEEVECAGEDKGISYKFEDYGTVRDLTSSTPDHTGFVFLIHVSEEQAKSLIVRETDTLKGMWMSKRELANNFNRFESWAQYIILSFLP